MPAPFPVVLGIKGFGTIQFQAKSVANKITVWARSQQAKTETYIVINMQKESLR
jgi:hypothetical protein